MSTLQSKEHEQSEYSSKLRWHITRLHTICTHRCVSFTSHTIFVRPHRRRFEVRATSKIKIQILILATILHFPFAKDTVQCASWSFHIVCMHICGTICAWLMQCKVGYTKCKMRIYEFVFDVVLSKTSLCSYICALSWLRKSHAIDASVASPSCRGPISFARKECKKVKRTRWTDEELDASALNNGESSEWRCGAKMTFTNECTKSQLKFSHVLVSSTQRWMKCALIIIFSFYYYYYLLVSAISHSCIQMAFMAAVATWVYFCVRATASWGWHTHRLVRITEVK